MAVSPEKYKWYHYEGKELELKGIGTADGYSLHLYHGEIIGYRKFGSKHFVIDKTNPEVRFSLNEKDVYRIIKNSRGWEGRVHRVKVSAGVGGLDKPAEEKDKGGWHFLQIDSSNLRDAAYNKKTKSLVVRFHNGAVWEYLNVTPKEARDLEAGTGFDNSQGRYFIYKIREVKEQHKSVWPENTSENQGKETVKFRVPKALFEKWLEVEQHAHKTSGESSTSVFSIIRRQRVDNENELMAVLNSLVKGGSSFGTEGERFRKAALKLMTEIAENYPFTAPILDEYTHLKKRLQ